MEYSREPLPLTLVFPLACQSLSLFMRTCYECGVWIWKARTLNITRAVQAGGWGTRGLRAFMRVLPSVGEKEKPQRCVCGSLLLLGSTEAESREAQSPADTMALLS